jgi:cell division septum initiation protein DivIVA
MSHGGDFFLGEGTASEPTFEVQVRGYNRKQVDRYVQQIEAEVAALVLERDQAYAQTQALAGQVQQLQVDISELKRRGGVGKKVSFRHLGPVVEQILTLAEEQAETIRGTATQDIDDRRVEAERVLAEAHAEADRLVEDARSKAAAGIRDFEIALAARRADEGQADEDRRTALSAELVETREHAAKLRAEAEDALVSAQQEARRINEATVAHVERTRAETDAWAGSARGQVHQELAQWRAATEHEVTERRTEAERELAALRSATLQECETLRVETERWAEQMRSRTDEHVAEAQHNLSAQLEDGERQLGTGQQQLATTHQEIAELGQRLAAAHQELAGARAQLAEIQQDTVTATHDRAQLREGLAEVQQQLTAERQRLADAQRAAEEAERDLAELRAQTKRDSEAANGANGSTAPTTAEPQAADSAGETEDTDTDTEDEAAVDEAVAKVGGKRT